MLQLKLKTMMKQTECFIATEATGLLETLQDPTQKPSWNKRI